MVDMEVPSGYVEFLKSLLPNKPAAEIYTTLGLQKHGKTLFYRDFLHHLETLERRLRDRARHPRAGDAGVHAAFLPVRIQGDQDAISPPKTPTEERVMEKYLLVKYHDRVGRMADTLEYKDVAFPKGRFAPEVLEELRALAPTVFEEEGDTLIVKHVYIERRMMPLNMHLDGADDAQVMHAIREYGNAIKQMAAANIFPGDLLFKNFGVTRFGRVVFYDYDEVAYMTDCTFRRMPAPRTPEDEMSAEPWYPVGANDVFPEEFAAFLLGPPGAQGIPRSTTPTYSTPTTGTRSSSASPPGISKTCFRIRRRALPHRFARRAS